MDSDQERHFDQDFFDKEDNTRPAGQEQIGPEIIIGIQRHQSRGSALKKHTVYLIKGLDKNGAFQVWRRFNEFHQMRQAMKKAWPGCLIPSLPSKNPITKNEEDINLKRSRYLNDFLKKVSSRSYLYYCEEFQALLRSQQINLSDTYAKWPSPSTESIIARYKQLFSFLSGKEISPLTNQYILKFYHKLQDYKKLLLDYRKGFKQLALQRDKYNKAYSDFFFNARMYQEVILTGFIEPNRLLYADKEQNQLLRHQQIIQKLTSTNPYWLLYDLIKNEERDGRAFQELIKTIQLYADKVKEVQVKIECNLKGIAEASVGKKNIKTLTMKGTTDEIKYQLEVQNQALKKEKQSIQTLRDIIIALACFLQIEGYKKAKKQFYRKTWNKLGKFEENFANNTLKIWQEIQSKLQKLVEISH